ncbi:MAG: L,D-transpeptidase family protein [Thermodesulfobacteriota bacterium]
MILEKNKIFAVFIFIYIFSCASHADSQGNSEKNWPENVIYTNEKPFNMILVDKKTQKLFLMEKKDENSFEKIFELNCSTGKKKGDKVLEGDARTPEGVYYVTGHYPEKYLSPVYGSRAFTLDYPNYIDKTQGRNGYNIWIHGTDEKLLEARTTNGCVALANEDIDKLENKIIIGKTPVLIMKDLKFSTKDQVSGKIGSELFDFFKKWLESYKAGTYHNYLSFYSPDYLPDINWWPGWKKLRGSMENLDIDPEYFNIFKESENLYTIWFDIKLSLDSRQVNTGKRKLFIRRNKDGLSIFGDIYMNETESLDIVSAAEKLKKEVFFEENIKNLVAEWKESWSDKDIDKYSGFYASSFYSDGKSKNEWIRYKKRLNRKYDYINIEIDDLEIRKKGETARAVFFQKYDSSGFETKGHKTLVFKQEDGEWKILREIWRKAG